MMKLVVIATLAVLTLGQDDSGVVRLPENLPVPGDASSLADPEFPQEEPAILEPVPTDPGHPTSPPGTWMNLWNHWMTSGGNGPNNLWVHLPDYFKQFQFYGTQNDCIPPGEPCNGVNLPCCSESYLSRRFCSSYANRCL